MSLADVLTLVAFAVFGLVCFRLRLSFRASVLLGLMSLAAAAAFLAAGLVDTADAASIAAFYFLLVGVLLALLQPNAMSLRDTIRYLARVFLRSRKREPDGARKDPPG